MSRTRHVPMRRCVVCRQSLPQPELHRLYRDDDGLWQLDPRRRAGGRGAWLCGRCRHQASGKQLKRFFRNQTPRIERMLRGEGQGAAPENEAVGGMNG